MPYYAVIDGKQRIETALAWYQNEFAVPASWFSPGDVQIAEDTEDGFYVRYSGLSLHRQRIFDNDAVIGVVEARVSTTAEEAEIYLLVNGGGTPQTDEDMANATQVATQRA